MKRVPRSRALAEEAVAAAGSVAVEVEVVVRGGKRDRW